MIFTLWSGIFKFARKIKFYAHLPNIWISILLLLEVAKVRLEWETLHGGDTGVVVVLFSPV